MNKIGIAIIGTGDRGCFVLGSRILDLALETGFRIEALCDINPKRLQDSHSYLSDRARKAEVEFHPRLYTDFKEAIDDPSVSLVMVTNHTYVHRDPAVLAMDRGKFLYLDKPIAVVLEDAEAILEAQIKNSAPVIMGFTRRYESSWKIAFNICAQGRIGELQMILIRSVIPYSRYFQMWHRQSQLSGGALNDKSSHHMDVFNWMSGSHCVRLTAIGGRSRIFAPDPAAPPYCAVCDRDCPYRREASISEHPEGSHVLGYESWSKADLIIDRADTCVYLPGADIDDHAIVTLEYANGIKASLFWTIFGPPAQDQETLELIGSSGRVLLTRSTGQIELISRFGKDREIIDARTENFGSSHYGADIELVRELRHFVDGKTPTVSVLEGVRALDMILAAKRSIDSGGQVQVLPMRYSGEH